MEHYFSSLRPPDSPKANPPLAGADQPSAEHKLFCLPIYFNIKMSRVQFADVPTASFCFRKDETKRWGLQLTFAHYIRSVSCLLIKNEKCL